MSPDVPLLDLRAQYDEIRDEIEPALSRVVESQHFVLGPEVEALEAEVREYLDAGHAVGCASGTDALLLPLKALEPREGDEVVVPTFSFFATAGAVWNAGFRPAFCDVDPETFNLTGAALRQAWTERTRAVVPVHLFGQMAPMEEIMEVVREKSGAGKGTAGKGAVGKDGDEGAPEVLVLEDAAQAIGARRDGRAAGTVGDCGAFSFFPTKNLGGFGDGGLITARDADFADRLRKLRVHGGRQMYHHEMVGTNSRLDALQAAVLRVKLGHLDRWTEARRRNARLYDELLADVDEVRLPVTDEGNRHTYNQYTVRARDRDGLRDFLADRGVGSGIYYPVPLHLQECFAELGHREGEFPVAEALCRNVLSLPIFPELGEDRLRRVADAVRAYYGA